MIIYSCTAQLHSFHALIWSCMFVFGWLIWFGCCSCSVQFKLYFQFWVKNCYSLISLTYSFSFSLEITNWNMEVMWVVCVAWMFINEFLRKLINHIRIATWIWWCCQTFYWHNNLHIFIWGGVGGGGVHFLKACFYVILPMLRDFFWISSLFPLLFCLFSLLLLLFLTDTGRNTTK